VQKLTLSVLDWAHAPAQSSQKRHFFDQLGTSSQAELETEGSVKMVGLRSSDVDTAEERGLITREDLSYIRGA